MMRFAYDRTSTPAQVRGRYVVVADGAPLKQRRRDGRMVHMAYDSAEAAEKGKQRAAFAGYAAEVHDDEEEQCPE